MVAVSSVRKGETLELSGVLIWHRQSFLQPTSTLVWTTALGIRWVQDYREKECAKTCIEWRNVRRITQLDKASEESKSVFDIICSERKKFGSPPSSCCCFLIESVDDSTLFLECSSVEQCHAWYNFCQQRVNAISPSAPNDENRPPAQHFVGKGIRSFPFRQNNIYSPALVASILFVCSMVAITAVVL